MLSPHQIVLRHHHRTAARGKFSGDGGEEDVVNQLVVVGQLGGVKAVALKGLAVAFHGRGEVGDKTRFGLGKKGGGGGACVGGMQGHG